MAVQPAFFENHEIRRAYDENTETWLFSVIDIIQVLTQQSNCYQLKLAADDGKLHLTDRATAATLLRLVQSVPSPKAEPIKLWLAKVGYERMQEMGDPGRDQGRHDRQAGTQGAGGEDRQAGGDGRQFPAAG